ncbi:arsenate reductase (glutaredoxin) [Hydrogenimonas cancrithermarum]|uniref:Arsenate reductase n=1 Tax=Hydrogenimonas cancrithermarum TaxID=2993563 RepID=A0ABN6WRL3_9BACT|nr:arsenate reductase (glutaredoxin) [Hydrogenimonas cancrithermarum]BDY11800.1 arsenate reductase [Hydrogenimonas cancrithermarum]
MANEVIIWHNPRCSKSREALKLLKEKGIEPKIYKYLDEHPSKEQIEEVLKMLGVSPRDIMRTKEAIYKELGLGDVEDDEKLIEAMVEHPRLIERPIVIKEGKAVLGRPPQKVIELIKE